MQGSKDRENQLCLPLCATYRRIPYCQVSLSRTHRANVYFNLLYGQLTIGMLPLRKRTSKIAEDEGECLPGFTLCAFVKATEHLKRIPVLLTTLIGNPTDYSNARSPGAVVCMSKPYRQERMGHVACLLAPPPKTHPRHSTAPRPPDHSRRTFNGNGAESGPSKGGSPRFRFHSVC